MGTPLNVLIAGGGIGGLALAAFLQHHHVSITIAERAEAWRPVGAGLTLGPNAVRVLDALGLGHDIRQRGVRLRQGLIADARGRVLSRVDLDRLERRVGVPSIAIGRAQLHQTLLEALQPGRVDIQLGARVAGVEANDTDARVQFADGTRQRCDLLVGADGLRSSLRDALGHAPALRYAGYVCFRFIARGVDHRAVGTGAIDRAMLQLGHGRRVGMVPIGPNELYCFASMLAPEGRAPYEGITRDALANLFAEFGGGVPGVFAALEPDHQFILDEIRDLPRPTWGHGAAVLLGDAAHASTPNLAQGAAMAIEDAMVLAGALARHDSIGEATARYRAVREPRVRRIAARSYAIGRMSSLAARPIVALRNLVLRATPSALAMRGNVRLVMDAPNPADHIVQT